MPPHRKRLKRYEHRNEARYLTCSCYNRLALFNNDSIKDHLVDYFIKSQNDLQYKVFAWALMPEHFHLLIQPAHPDQTIEQILRRIKSGFAYSVIQRWIKLDAPILNRIKDSRGARHFWQRGGGYDRNIYSDSELIEKIRYIHNNPARRNLVESLGDWPWSSARWYEHRDDYTGPPIFKPTQL